jgi:nitrite reductase (NADH) small subunit
VSLSSPLNLTLALPAETTRARPANESAGEWRAVCALEDIVPNTGVCALVDGEQVAIVRV